MCDDSFLKEEYRLGYKVTTQMKRVWAVELDLVSELLRVCNKYDLRCFLDAGSLLGAVRHKGFIPWDDDIDMVMFRKDYDKLVSISEKEFRYPYFFQCAYTDSNYIRGHAQFRNSQTTGISPNDINQNFNQGIAIDIFVLDGVLKDSKALKKQKRKTDFLRQCMWRNVYGIPFSLNPKSFLKNVIYQLANLLIPNIYQQFENEFRKVDVEECEFVAPLCFIFDIKKRIRNKHMYDNTILLDFEYLKLLAPAHYHEFLTQRYGDYLKPAQIPTSHGKIIYDAERTYTDVLAELRKSQLKIL